MSAKKFKFISPGVFLNEIDNSQLAKESDDIGPVIVGRARMGPALRPVRIESFSQFVEIFGDPIAGSSGQDIWREGNGLLAPAYGAYAAQAYLKNSSPINYVRLLGVHDDEKAVVAAGGVGDGQAGWVASNAFALLVGQASGSNYYDPSCNSGGSTDGNIAAAAASATVGAVFYTTSDTVKIRLKGQMVLGPRTVPTTGLSTMVTSSAQMLIRGVATTSSWSSGAAPEWTAEVYDGSTLKDKITFNFKKTSPRYIRKVFNTNPAMTNQDIVSVANKKLYWLGESYENHINNVTMTPRTSGLYPFACTLPLGDTSFDGEDYRQSMLPAQTNWFISQRMETDLTQAAGSLAIADGDAAHGMAEKETLTIVAKDAQGVTTSRTYVVVNGADSVVATGTVLALNSDTGASTAGAGLVGGIAVNFNLSNATQASALNDFKLAINHANGHNGKIVVGPDVAVTDGAKTMTLTQLAAGSNGNTTIIDGLGGITATSFTGGGGFDASKQPKLFKLLAHDAGSHTQRNFKVSIKDVKAARADGVNPYGSFSLLVRKAGDSDIAPQIVEQFSNCNLNPNSSNYLARKIGDMHQTWSTTERRYKMYGSHPNLSKYFRVVMDTDVDMGSAEAELLPFGVLGIPVYKDAALLKATAGSHGWLGTQKEWGDAANPVYAGGPAAVGLFNGFDNTINVSFPTLPLRVSASHGSISNQKDAYFGVWTHRSTGSIRHDESYADHVSPLPVDASGEKETPSTLTQYSWVFTLDDIIQTGTSNNTYYHSSGSRERGVSLNAVKANDNSTDSGYRAILAAGIDKFTAPVFGGFDGVDITEAEPFNNRVLRDKSETNSYEFASVRRALDSVSDPEVVEANLMAMPGITVDALTKQLMSACEARADALAIIDIDKVYTPQYEQRASNFAARLGTGASAVASAFQLRGLNSSYGCTYYPWVKIYDEINDASVWAPPSIVALGVMANTENRDALWFAPAGFNRGGLTEGGAGISVLGVSEKLTSKERDTLYDASINPIASFPSEGIVVFGQKTLQVTPSALDRINVRRLLIYVKKEVSRIASRLLFDQNVQTTWERFVQEVSPFLERVKIGFGLSDFKVVLDATTTTPDLVDRNIMYAKIFLKPARAVEFIAVDFVITNTGAAFED